jgi:hypothetical protein
MTKVLLGALVAAMLALTGVVAYSHFTAAPSADATASDGCPQSGCKACSSCCALELPPAESTSAGCNECEKAKKAAAEETAKTEVKEEK